MGDMNVFTPSLLLSEIYYAYQDKSGFMAEVVEKVAENGFYGAVEVGVLRNASERKRIQSITSKSGLMVTQWMTPLIDENNLDLSSIDSGERERAVEILSNNLYLAAECGATNVALVSGPYVARDEQQQAEEGFYESLCRLCDEAGKYSMHILFEPLDRLAHKKKFMGSTAEACKMIEAVRKSNSNISLAFDTAHAALNGEVIEESLTHAKKIIDQIHFSNAVLDPQLELYGDNHMCIGDPGFLTVERLAKILKKAIELRTHVEKDLRIAVEVRNLGQDGVHFVEEQTRDQLKKAMYIAMNYDV